MYLDKGLPVSLAIFSPSSHVVSAVNDGREFLEVTGHAVMEDSCVPVERVGSGVAWGDYANRDGDLGFVHGGILSLKSGPPPAAWGEGP